MYVIRATYHAAEGMWFDAEYYERNHIPLARRLLAGHVSYRSMHAEFDMVALMEGQPQRAPCVFALVVESLQDVEDFRAFRAGPHVQPLKDDIQNYTNLVPDWTVARMVLG